MKLLGAIIEGEDIVNKKYVDDAISGSSDVFVATFGETTNADLQAAINANKTIYVVDNPFRRIVTNPTINSSNLVGLQVSFPASGLGPLTHLATTYTVDVNNSWNRVATGIGVFGATAAGEVAIANADKQLVSSNVLLSDLAQQTDIANLQYQIDGLGEPFRVKQWAANGLNVNIPTCTTDINNTGIDKMVFSITGQEGTDFQVVGMIAYEIFDADSGGNRINAWPVCQFTGNGQKELQVRWMCGGTTPKTAKRINSWVLLKHR